MKQQCMIRLLGLMLLSICTLALGSQDRTDNEISCFIRYQSPFLKTIHTIEALRTHNRELKYFLDSASAPKKSNSTAFNVPESETRICVTMQLDKVQKSYNDDCFTIARRLLYIGIGAWGIYTIGQWAPKEYTPFWYSVTALSALWTGHSVYQMGRAACWAKEWKQSVDLHTQLYGRYKPD